jgi:hypothetical protein
LPCSRSGGLLLPTPQNRRADTHGPALTVKILRRIDRRRDRRRCRRRHRHRRRGSETTPGVVADGRRTSRPDLSVQAVPTYDRISTGERRAAAAVTVPRCDPEGLRLTEMRPGRYIGRTGIPRGSSNLPRCRQAAPQPVVPEARRHGGLLVPRPPTGQAEDHTRRFMVKQEDRRRSSRRFPRVDMTYAESKEPDLIKTWIRSTR